jgi:hypothetical protein
VCVCVCVCVCVPRVLYIDFEGGLEGRGGESELA